MVDLDDNTNERPRGSNGQVLRNTYIHIRYMWRARFPMFLRASASPVPLFTQRLFGGFHSILGGSLMAVSRRASCSHIYTKAFILEARYGWTGMTPKFSGRDGKGERYHRWFWCKVL